MRITLVKAFALCLLIGSVPAGVQADTGCTASKAAFKAAILKATNATRSRTQRCGSRNYATAAALKWNDKLRAAAASHSTDMARNNFFSHTGSDGLKSWDRASNRGYRYRAIGENIAAGYSTLSATQAGWVDSAGHCRNIMNPDYTEMGAACVSDSGADYQRYWTVVFGRPQ